MGDISESNATIITASDLIVGISAGLRHAIAILNDRRQPIDDAIRRLRDDRDLALTMETVRAIPDMRNETLSQLITSDLRPFAASARVQEGFHIASENEPPWGHCFCSWVHESRAYRRYECTSAGILMRLRTELKQYLHERVDTLARLEDVLEMDIELIGLETRKEQAISDINVVADKLAILEELRNYLEKHPGIPERSEVTSRLKDVHNRIINPLDKDHFPSYAEYQDAILAWKAHIPTELYRWGVNLAK